MVTGGRVEVSVKFDNIYEAAGWVEREYRGFRKDALIVFRFNKPEDMTRALNIFEGSFLIGNKFYVPMGIIDERRFLDEAEDLVEKVRNFGGIVVEAEVTAIKDAANDKALDELFNDVRREIELWNFARAVDSLPKERV